jgi:nucleoid DNA-binding protein
MDIYHLVEEIALRHGLPPNEAVQCVTNLREAIIQTLEQDEVVSIPGFGHFAVKSIPSWHGTHPVSKMAVDLPAKKIPYFRSSPELRRRLNHGWDWVSSDD